MLKKIVLFIVLLIALSTVMVACSKPAATTNGTFIVGFDQEFPPMGFLDENGNFAGFDLDLAAEAAKRMGKELKLQPIAWDSKDMELESGNIDCIWNGFTMNNRENDYEWTTPYMKNRQVMVVLKDSSYQTLADLAGKAIALQRDSSAESALESAAEFKASVTPNLTDTNLNALMNLETGAVDGVLMDEIVARYSIEKRDGNYRVLDEALADENFGVGFKKGNTELRDAVQKVLEEMAKDGKLAEISNTWFGKDITTIGK